MANYFNQPDDGFKKPAVPTRYRRQTYNTTTQTLCNNVVTTQNTFTSNSLDEIEQRISVFRRLYPPEDPIWRDLINYMNNLSYVKLAEQVRGPGSQASSVYNGASVSQTLFFQNARQLCGARSNYASSAYNTQDYAPESIQIQECNRAKNNFITPVWNDAEQGPSRSYSVTNDVAHEPVDSVRSTTSRRTRKKSHIGEQNDLNAALIPGLQIPVKSVQQEAPVMKKPTGKNAARRTVDSTIKQTEHVVHSVKEPVDCPIRRNATNLSQQNVDCSSKIKSPVKKAPMNNLTRGNSKKQTPLKKLNILPSEDENDSLYAFFQRRRKLVKKSTQPATNLSDEIDISGTKIKTADVSVSLNRVTVTDHMSENKEKVTTTRKRRLSPSRTVSKAKRQSLESENNSGELKEADDVPKPKTNKRTAALTMKRSNSSATRRATVPTAKRRSAASVKQTQVETRPTCNKPTAKQLALIAKNKKDESSPVCGFEQLDDRSFFGDVSSIVGDASPLTNTVVRTVTRRPKKNGNEMPSHFFSPFANVRSTSGFSAISTPLSKSTAKNVLGKRLKKPSVAAELKDRLKPRKKTNDTLKVDIRPISEVTAVTESDCEASDFSDS